MKVVNIMTDKGRDSVSSSDPIDQQTKCNGDVFLPPQTPAVSPPRYV